MAVGGIHPAAEPPHPSFWPLLVALNRPCLGTVNSSAG